MSVADEIERQRLAAEAKAMGIPEWAADAVRAVPDNLVRDIVRDSFRGISKSASMIPQHQRDADEPPRPSGSTVPVRQPPGLRWVDAQLDAADHQDRVARIRQQVENDWIEGRLAERTNPHQARTEYDPIAAHDASVPPMHRSKRKP